LTIVVIVVLLFWLVRILFVMWLRAVRLIMVMGPWLLPLCARLSWLARVLALLLRVWVLFVLLWAVRLVVAMWHWLICALGLGLLQAAVRIRFVVLLRLLWVVPLIVAMRL
jgi:hypothetical protein